MKDAPIIILDEATANVDPENEKELMEAIAELTHDKTVIMIANMGKGKHISMETLLRICKALNCGILNVIELEHDEEAEISN